MNLRKAIITGSIKYKESHLNFPDKDMKLIENTLLKRCALQESDITCILHNNKSEDYSFIEKLENTCQKLEQGRTNSYDLIVFYYSGHGVFKTEEQISYIQISDETFIAIDEIINTVSKVNAKNKYFIVDACQSGGFSLMKPKGKLQRQYSFNSNGVYCMFGATKHQNAFEPSLRDIIRKKINNSFYTHFIAEALNTKSNYHEGTVSIRIVDDYASRKTPSYTNFEQIPISTTETSGYFPFGFWDEEKQLEDISVWENQKEEISYTSNQESDIVNYLANKIISMFSDERYLFIIPDKEMLSRLSQPAKDLLNEKLDLKNKIYNGKPLINGLLSVEGFEKYSFLTFILEQQEIEVDITSKDDRGKSALFEAIQNKKYSAHYIIELLFMRGYQLSEEDASYLDTEFKNPSVRPEILENIAIAIICYKLNDSELITKFRRVERAVFSILSYKKNKVIGYKMNHTALANNFLQHHKDFSNIFLKALKVYKHYDLLKAKPSFTKKESEILAEMPFQETGYDDIFMILFPEIFK